MHTSALHALKYIYDQSFKKVFFKFWYFKHQMLTRIWLRRIFGKYLKILSLIFFKKLLDTNSEHILVQICCLKCQELSHMAVQLIRGRANYTHHISTPLLPPSRIYRSSYGPYVERWGSLTQSGLIKSQECKLFWQSQMESMCFIRLL